MIRDVVVYTILGGWGNPRNGGHLRRRLSSPRAAAPMILFICEPAAWSISTGSQERTLRGLPGGPGPTHFP